MSIDDLLREVIAGLTPLDHPTMPETKLTQGEITLCLQILDHMTDDLFTSTATLSLSDRKRI